MERIRMTAQILRWVYAKGVPFINVFIFDVIIIS
jgi:hypothetical protein